MDKYPLITIGVSAYNRANYLPFCLDSLLAQTYPNCEIIVVDDGSSDNTRELMQTKYPQIKYVYQENAGDAAAKNHAAELAQGKYIVFNDSDDLFYPDTVERLYKALDPADENACSYGTYQTIDANGKELPTKRKMAVYPSGKITKELLQHIIVNNCGTLIPLKLFKKCNCFNTELKVSYDWALFLEMSLSGTFAAVQEPVFLRRRHSSNLSSASYAKLHIAWQVLENFLSGHKDIEVKYDKIGRKRRADFHRKLYREAVRENLKDKTVFHAKAAFKLEKNIKNFIAVISALVKK
jgi:glycosyltransferase involved in cell wall biosynthesis